MTIPHGITLCWIPVIQNLDKHEHESWTQLFPLRRAEQPYCYHHRLLFRKFKFLIISVVLADASAMHASDFDEVGIVGWNTSPPKCDAPPLHENEFMIAEKRVPPVPQPVDYPHRLSPVLAAMFISKTVLQRIN